MYSRLLFLVSIALVFFIIVLSGCHKNGDNTPTPISSTLFTMKAEDTYKTDQTDNWVVLNDANGEVIDFKPFEGGTSLSVNSTKTLPGSTLTVTLVRHAKDNLDKHYYHLQSYFEIPIGDSWVLSQPQFPTPALAGSFHVEITNVSLREVHLTDGSLYESGWSQAGTTTELPASIRTGFPNFHLSLRSSDGAVKHKYLPNVKDQDSYSFTWNDFEDFDNVATFTFPATANMTLLVIGREAGQSFMGPGYTTCFFYPFSGSEQTVTAGYMNSLTKYQTQLNLQYGTHGYQYIQYGGVPGAISWPDPAQFKLDNTSFGNFSSTATGSFVYRYSSWFFNTSTTSISWTAMSTSVSQAFKGLPAELLSQHADLDMAKIQHTASDFYIKAPAYNVVIGVSGKSQDWPDPTELLSVELF